MQLSTSELAQLLLQQVTGRHKALTFTQMTKRLDMYKSVPHSLSQRMSQPGRASFAMLTAGAGTVAVPTEDRRTQSPHLHPDDRTLDIHKSVPHSLRQRVSQPGLALLELRTAGAGAVAVPTEDRRA
jgi:hypothetical protein